MNEFSLIDALVAQTGATTEEVQRFLAELAQKVQRDILEGKESTIAGLGKFMPVVRKAHPGRNPQTGEEITVPAHVVIRFSPAKEFKKALNTSV